MTGGLTNQKAVNQMFINLQLVEKAKQGMTIEKRKKSFRKLNSKFRSAMTPEMIKAKRESLRENKDKEKRQRKIEVDIRNYARKKARLEQDEKELIISQKEEMEKTRVDKKVNKLWDRFYRKEFGAKTIKSGNTHNRQ